MWRKNRIHIEIIQTVFSSDDAVRGNLVRMALKGKWACRDSTVNPEILVKKEKQVKRNEWTCTCVKIAQRPPEDEIICWTNFFFVSYNWHSSQGTGLLMLYLIKERRQVWAEMSRWRYQGPLTTDKKKDWKIPGREGTNTNTSYRPGGGVTWRKRRYNTPHVLCPPQLVSICRFQVKSNIVL